MACTVTNLKNASCVCTRRRVMGSGSMISMMRLLLSLFEASTRRNGLVLSCASSPAGANDARERESSSCHSSRTACRTKAKGPCGWHGGGGSPQKGSVIRMITITGLFHPARHGTRRPGALHSRWFGRGRRRRNRGRELEARQIFENAIEIADLHRMLLHHGRHGSGELIDLPRSDTT